jgi:hypothetical protein
LEISLKTKDLLKIGVFLRSGAMATMLVMLTGCGIQHSDLLFKEKKLTSDTAGFVVMALGHKTPTDIEVDKMVKRVGLHIEFASATNTAGTKYQITTTAHNIDGGAWKDTAVVRTNPSGKRVLVGYSVPPGKYVLTGQSVYLWGNFNYGARPQLTQPLEFEVRPNSVTYLGVREVEIDGGKNILNMTVPGQVRVNALNEFKDDIELLYSNRPDLRNLPIINVFGR